MNKYYLLSLLLVPIVASVAISFDGTRYAIDSLTICHMPDSDEPQTMEIPTSESGTYVNAGDLLGSCESHGLVPQSSSSVDSCVPIACSQVIPDGCTKEPDIVVDGCTAECGAITCSSSSDSSSSVDSCVPIACPLALPDGCTVGTPTIVDGCQVDCGQMTCSSSSSSSQESSVSSSTVLSIEEIRDNIENTRDLQVLYRGNGTAANAAVLHSVLINYNIDNSSPYIHTYTFNHELLKPARFDSRSSRNEWFQQQHDMCCSLYRYLQRLHEIHPQRAEEQLDWLSTQMSSILGEDYKEMRDALQGHPHDHEHTDALLKSIKEETCK